MILGALGPKEIILILAVVLLLFGGKKIPELMKGLGRGVREFKDASKGEETTTAETTENKQA
ncbi:MAG: twin-arginine translocase TatA/TatE family subunit [Crocinitomicaceae bacterium]|jgi:sec-independent protein translocase protein TatA|nr:twin-arginine translocase TatA/TatE family subunit [Crocinitomicaceae bacterium]